MIYETTRKINILINVEEDFIPKAEYILRTFCGIIGLQPEFYHSYTLEDVSIYYGTKTNDSYPITIYYEPETAVFFDKELSYDIKDVHFINYRSTYIPFLFSQRGRLFHKHKEGLVIRKDIIASAFYFMSCWEEYLTLKGKRENSLTIAQELGFYYIPIVDKYCEILQKALEIELPGYQKMNKWSEEENFVVTIAHQLKVSDKNQFDKVLKKIRKLIGSERKRGLSSTILLEALNNEDEAIIPTERAGELLNELKGNDAQNKRIPEHCYGLLTKKRYSHTKINEIHKIYAKKGLIFKGHCLENMTEHYSTLFAELEQTPIEYDMSIYHQGSIAFRTGCSFPFYPFNLLENKAYKVLEIPPVVSQTSKNKANKENRNRFDTLPFANTKKNYLLRNFHHNPSPLMIMSEVAIEEKIYKPYRILKVVDRYGLNKRR